MADIPTMDMAPPAKLINRPLQAKLMPQARSPYQVERVALRDALCAAGEARVALVRAPAGFGKSTVMLQAMAMLREQGVACAWLTLDVADNDISRLLGFLRAALEPLMASEPLTDDSAAGALALDLMDRLAAIPAPFALFLDDVEVLQNPAAFALLRQLISSLPRGARLILGSRVLPDVGLARLRARGELLEIDPTQLRFSADETENFLQEKRGLTLAPKDVSSLHATTEGWAVALWLASVALLQHEDRGALVERFSGSHAAVADYLAEEVLALQAPRLRDFMLRTSILPQLNADLCDAVCAPHLQAGESRALLDALERENLFLLPVDQERQWFRYHSLFTGFLRTQLERRFPQELASLHRRAAEWYVAQHRPVPAIEQALASGDMKFALPLFAHHAERLLGEGRVRLLARLLDTVPPADLRRWSRLRAVHVWALACTRGAIDAMTLLNHYENDGGDDELAMHALALRPMLLSILDRHDEAYTAARRDIDRLPPRHAFPHAILRTSLAYVALVMGQYGEAQELLDEGRRLQAGESSSFTLIFAQCVEGAIDLLHGRLRQATVRFRIAAGADTRRASSYTNGNAMAGILLAEVLYEADELADAERLLHVYVPLMEEQGVPDHVISGHRNLARILQSRGDCDGARQTVTELEYYGHRAELPRLVASARLERARLALFDGDRKTAREELQRARAVGDWEKFGRWSLFGSDLDTPVDGELRWQIHFGNAADAATQLKTLIERADAARRYRRALKMRVLLALALDRSGNEKAALRLLRETLRSAAAERFVRIFLDEGEPLQALLHKLSAAHAIDASDPQLADTRALFELLLRSTTPLAAPAPVITTGLASAAPIEALTKKERETLALLAEGLTSAGIGSRLFVSETTVRTHLRNINAKLHVHNRIEAVAAARRLGLLS